MSRKLFLADRLIDAVSSAPIEGAAMLVEGDRIVAVGRAADIGRPDGAEVIEAETLMPGLVDVHVHLAYSGAKDPGAFRAESARIDYPRIALRAAKYAQDTLDHGYTAVRDMHAPGGTIVDLRDAVNEGRVPGPRIAACGLGLTVTGGHMDQPGFGDHMSFRDMNAACEGPVGFRAGVRAQVKRGADFIKLNPCVGNRRGERLWRFEMTVEEIAAACDEAHECGMMVGAHTSGGPPLRAAIEAGCDTVEHAHWIDDDTLDLMIQRGTWLVPTLAVNEATAGETMADPDADPGRYRWAEESVIAMWERLSRARAAGVRIAAGSDAGFYLAHGAGNGREIELFIKGGYAPLEAIGVATANGADLMGLEAGRLKPGLLADIVRVKGNPLEDISLLRDPANLTVWKSGDHVAGRL